MLERYNPFRRSMTRREEEPRRGMLRPWTDWDFMSDLDVFPRGFGATDVSEDENNLTFKVDMPGMKADDIDIQAEGGTLTITTERRSEREEKKKTYHRVERSYGGFCRSFQLPSTVDPSKVEATYDEGVLTVNVPKTEESKARKITVKSS
jgi:HSP20 family protein